MLTILHGDNIVSSRNELTRLKEAAQGKDVRDIDGKDIPESDLRQAVESLSLFGNTVCIVLENVFSPLGKKEKQMKLFAGILSEAAVTVDIILWESKELSKTVLGYLDRAKIQLYKTPPIIFEFLDSLGSQNTKEILTVFGTTVETVPVELVLYMTETRVRQLIQIKDGITPEKTSSWQAMRLTNQGKSFTMDKLLAMHNRLIELEYSYKTGKTPFTLSQLITQFILDI